MITTIVPSFTKVPNINDSVNFETDVNTFLNEINARYVAGNTQVSEINSTANDINAKATAVLNQAVSGGYSQAYINRALISAYTELVATGGETSILTPSNTNVNVYKNGRLLALTTDYTLNGDGATIDFVVSLSVSDLVQVFDLSKLNNAFYLKNETYSKTEVDNFSVKLTGDQTINGIKTFNSFPITPSLAPTEVYQIANKKYVDDNKTPNLNFNGNLNALKTIGFYQIDAAASNKPTAGYFACIVYGLANDLTGQLLISSNGEVYSRIGDVTPTWTSWKRLDLDGLGVSQSRIDVTGSRAKDITYTNTGLLPKFIIITLSGGGGVTATLTVNNITSSDSVGSPNAIVDIVQAGESYSLSGSATISRWVELG